MNIIVADKTYLVEIPIAKGSTVQKINFPTIDNLNGKFTTSIETFIPEVNPVGLSNTPLANSPLLAVSYLTLVVGDINWVWNVPLLKFVNLNNEFNTGIASSLFQVEFNLLQIIWAKSFITIADVTKISAAQDEEFQFNIFYSDIKQS